MLDDIGALKTKLLAADNLAKEKEEAIKVAEKEALDSKRDGEKVTRDLEAS
jgi:hypothetical protein